jgi:autotransporter passenger strand-loop-strand repeat protein
MAIGTTISSGGAEVVESGGITSNTLVSSAGC